jgi:hypothetical protein
MDNVESKMYKGMSSPTVQVNNEDTTGGIVVSLESLNADLHNQSYGMVDGSTGCLSNPGGPSC